MFVVTLNTWKCDGNYAGRMAELESQLPKLQPDLLLLQEVFAAPELGEDTASRVADCLPGHQLVQVPARKKIRRFAEQEAISTSGLAVLVRGQVLDARVLQLPDIPADRNRIAQIIDVEIDRPEYQRFEASQLFDGNCSPAVSDHAGVAVRFVSLFLRGQAS